MELERQLLELEHGFWKGDADFYREHLSGDALMVLPEPGGFMAAAAVVDSIAGGPRWEEVGMEDVRLLRPTRDVAVLAYRARARREGDDRWYAALVSSAYVGRDGSWELAFHQQTPTAAG